MPPLPPSLSPKQTKKTFDMVLEHIPKTMYTGNGKLTQKLIGVGLADRINASNIATHFTEGSESPKAYQKMKGWMDGLKYVEEEMRRAQANREKFLNHLLNEGPFVTCNCGNKEGNWGRGQRAYTIGEQC